MNTLSSIFVSFVTFQYIFNVDIMCSNTEYVECLYSSTDFEGILTVECSNDSQQIEISNPNSDYLQCSNYDSYTHVQKNKIGQVYFENCQMKKLTFNHDIFEVYKNLKELDISYIGLEWIEKETLATAGSLIKLDANHNNIQDVPVLLFLNAGNLNETDFSHNQIKRLDSFALSGARELKRADFSYNQIENISGLIFDNLSSLTYIDLSHNEISVLGPNTFTVLKKLSTLDLSFNNIKKLSKNIFSGLNKLQILRLDRLSNETIEIEPSAFIGLYSLKQLHLSQNHIASINMGVFEGINNLKILSLYPTIIDELAKFAFSGISQTTELDLSCNRLFNSNNISQITILDKEAFDNLINLQRLNLANNPIGVLNIGTFSKLENLQYLNLSNTNLSEIRLGTFSHTRELKSLDLSWNQLKTVDFSLFLPRYLKLESLYLNENRLTELEGLTHNLFPSLKILGITGNNFDCSYLKEFLRKIMWQNITFVNDYWAPLNPHEINIYGVKCGQVEENETKSTVIMIDASTTTTTTTTTIKLDVHEDVKLKQENFTNLDVKQLTTSLTEAFSIFSQGQNDLHIIRSLLMIMCFILSMLFIIVLIINRDKLLNIPRYRGFSRKRDRQSRTCINNDIEVSTFSHENNNVS